MDSICFQLCSVGGLYMDVVLIPSSYVYGRNLLRYSNNRRKN